MKKNNPITSLYIHIPFCVNICDYCDFTKLQYFRFLAEKYLIFLKKEIEITVENKSLKTIFVGGGTPTSLEDDLFLELLEIIKPYSDQVEEYTFECNPESLSLNKIKMMKEYGVNRISIGVESTNDKILKAINRHHTFNDVKIAVKNLRKVGFDNYNIDLILGLPNVTLKMLKKDIDNILSLKPKHISSYALSVHPNTVFYSNKIEEPNEDYFTKSYKLIHEELLKNGFIHYEVSNFALPEYESKHNKVYWANEQYYGVGLSASGYINNQRYKNTSSINKYLDGNLNREIETVSKKDYEEYYIMLKLRTNEGIDLDEYKYIFNKDLYSAHKEDIDAFVRAKLLVLDRQKLIATFDGFLVLDTIILKLI